MILIFVRPRWRRFLLPSRLIHDLPELLCTFLSCVGWDARQPVDPNVLIEKYRGEEINAVALLHHLAQAVQFQLELKETVTPGKVCRSSWDAMVKVLGVACLYG